VVHQALTDPARRDDATADRLARALQEADDAFVAQLNQLTIADLMGTAPRSHS
jgi:hypothetical protein